MILPGSVRLCLLGAAMLASSRSNAGVWGMQPTIGVIGDYNTNAALINVPNTAEVGAALLLDAPTVYTADAFSFTVLPSFRISNAQGYSTVDSDYSHMNVKSEWDSERSTFTASAGVARDSSLYYQYTLNGPGGVERNSLLGDVAWQRYLSERVELSADLNSQHVRYGEAAGAPTLTDYKYTSFTPTVAWTNSERDKLTASVNFGLYNSIPGTTQSKSASLQFGYTHQLQELWSWSATGGYSRALNRVDYSVVEIVDTDAGPAFAIVPVRLESTQNSTVFLGTVTRQGARLTLSATASRNLVPTGLAYLSTQESLAFNASFAFSPRWSLTSSVAETKIQNPAQQQGAPDYSARVTVVTLQTSWQWTEHWTVTASAGYVLNDVTSSNVNVSNNSVSLQLSRQFNRIAF